jgi:TolB protein
MSLHHAHALDWQSLQFWRKSVRQTRTANELKAARTLSLGEFTGSTGATAALTLAAQLSKSEGLQLITTVARYTLAGRSVGGRITAVLSERNGQMIFDRSYAAPGIQDNVKALADDVQLSITGRAGLASSQVAFVSDFTGAKQIYVCDADGANVEQVTRHSTGCTSPSINTDFLAYTGYTSGMPRVVVVDMGAGQERQITATPGMNSDITFAKDGRRVALTMSFVGNPEIFVLDLPTSHAVCVTESVGTPASPAWHPGGELLAFSSNEGQGPRLFIVDTGTERPATPWPTGYAFSTDPEWAPDGKRIALTVRSAGDYAVAVKPYPSGTARIVQRGAQHPTWSPDGRSLAYVQNGQLWIHDLESNQRRSIVTGRGEISEPTWMR